MVTRFHLGKNSPPQGKRSSSRSSVSCDPFVQNEVLFTPTTSACCCLCPKEDLFQKVSMFFCPDLPCFCESMFCKDLPSVVLIRWQRSKACSGYVVHRVQLRPVGRNSCFSSSLATVCLQDLCNPLLQDCWCVPLFQDCVCVPLLRACRQPAPLPGDCQDHLTTACRQT